MEATAWKSVPVNVTHNDARPLTVCYLVEVNSDNCVPWPAWLALQPFWSGLHTSYFLSVKNSNRAPYLAVSQSVRAYILEERIKRLGRIGSKGRQAIDRNMWPLSRSSNTCVHPPTSPTHPPLAVRR